MKLIFLNTYIIAVKETSKPSEPSAHYLCLLPLTLVEGIYRDSKNKMADLNQNSVPYMGFRMNPVYGTQNPVDGTQNPIYGTEF